jgi:hypothetical protein
VRCCPARGAWPWVCGGAARPSGLRAGMGTTRSDTGRGMCRRRGARTARNRRGSAEGVAAANAGRRRTPTPSRSGPSALRAAAAAVTALLVRRARADPRRTLAVAHQVAKCPRLSESVGFDYEAWSLAAGIDGGGSGALWRARRVGFGLNWDRSGSRFASATLRLPLDHGGIDLALLTGDGRPDGRGRLVAVCPLPARLHLMVISGRI